MNKVAVIGNYLPRQCGIATFTADLCEAMASEFPDVCVFAVPVNDTGNGYQYPLRVRFELSENDLASYRQAADFLNINRVDAVCVQHEFGIYGGPDGSHLLSLLRELRTPIVTTLHTIPLKPTPTQRKVLAEIADRSDRLVVMSKKGAEFLQDIYGVPKDKVDLIPHGIHDVPFGDPNFYKDSFGVEGKFVILTFGLLSQNKGIEYVIQALPEVLEKYPKTVFVVVGATHPNVKRTGGETYRLSLQRMARKLGVEKNVIFQNRFVTLEELMEFIGSADVYVTPYLNQDQITSGTLAYALGAGKAVISTPYWYAEELLGNGAGVLVPFKAPDALSQAVVYLLEHEAERHAMRKQAYLLGRKMIWPEVAKRYMRSLHQAAEERCARPRVRFAAKAIAENEAELPVLKLDHLKQLTDDVGLLQHAVGSVPNYWEGYATDDNARGLVLSVLLEELGREWILRAGELPSRYMAFLWYAFNPETGRFRNFMGYDRTWKEEVGSEDSHGRAVWGLATVLGRSRQEGLRRAADRLFELALPAISDFQNLRPTSYALIGIHDYLRRYRGDRAVRRARSALAKRLLSAYQQNASVDWPWFEDRLSYGNARLPHALLLCGRSMRQPEMIEAALKALDWLAKIQTGPDDHFVPIGNDGFYGRNGTRARFDQQPIEAHAMLSACIVAYQVTSDKRWEMEAGRSFDWFLGGNDLAIPLYDPTSDGCYDGVGPHGINTNQGAESTLSFLMSLAELRLHQHVIPPPGGEPEGGGEAVAVDRISAQKPLEVAR